MERRFDMTNFEQSLRDHADQFTMTPSKRTWNGIYNNLHPGSRWPSITVALVLLFTLITVGHLNNTSNPVAGNTSLIKNQENKIAVKPERQVAIENTTGAAIVHSPNNSPSGNISSATASSKQVVPVDKSLMTKKDNSSSYKETGKIAPDRSVTAAPVEQPVKTIARRKNVNEPGTSGIAVTKERTKINDPATIKGNSTINSLIHELSAAKLNTITYPGKSEYLLKEPQLTLIDYRGFIENEKPVISINNSWSENLPGILSLSRAPVVFSEDHSLESVQKNNNTGVNKENKPAKNNPVHPHKKRNPKVNWIYFATPTVSSVFFSGKAIQPLSSQNVSPIVVQQIQNRRNMLYNARLGYKVGSQMTYAFSKKWQFTTGANLSYSGYNIISNQVHPTFAYLMLKNERVGGVYANSYITHYGNGQGLNQIMLSNKNWQLSVPVGLQYVFWGNKNTQITLASSLEPSMVVKSNAYIISSDGRNYVSDPSLLRQFNVSGNFGSYITFSSRKIKWQVGPDVRYQILSTYKKSYPVREHLIDYGIRIGISK